MLRLNVQGIPNLSRGSGILGVIQYGDSPDPVVLPSSVPRLNVTSRIWGQHAANLIFSGDAVVNYGVANGFQYAFDRRFLFATLAIPEAATESSVRDAAALEQTVYRAYSQAFELMRDLGVRHLWRSWNYLSDINEEAHGLERYRQFNVGRHKAFEENFALAHGSMPAACALGTQTPGLVMGILASTSDFEQIENPRQDSAYEYPAQYGPRSPTFSRAVLGRIDDKQYFLVSGTASIIGHASVHEGNVVAQTLEALNNIRMVIAEANRKLAESRYSLENLFYLAYVRHERDFAAVESALRSQIPGATDMIVFLQADICRKELLVEIEAFCLDQ